MKRELMAITADLVRQSAAAGGWERVKQWDDDTYGVLVKWRNADGREAIVNDPEPFAAPLRYATRARVLATLLQECPRCGAAAVERDPQGLTPLELDRAQVSTVPTSQAFGVALGEFAGVAVEQVGDAAHIVLLHDPECDAAPANLDELAQAGWN